jgi:hypothetical protein
MVREWRSLPITLLGFHHTEAIARQPLGTQRAFTVHADWFRSNDILPLWFCGSHFFALMHDMSVRVSLFAPWAYIWSVHSPLYDHQSQSF